MGEDSRKASNSWKKLVISKSNNEWTSSLKNNLKGGEMSTSGYSFSEIHTPFVEVKVEEDALPIQGTAISECSSTDNNVPSDGDPLLDARKQEIRGLNYKLESPEERACRLAKMSAYAAQRLANETSEQRAIRLKRMSAYAAKRLSQETSEQRAKRLARMSAYAAKRLSQETPEQRQARLARMSAYAAKRHAMKKLMQNHNQS